MFDCYDWELNCRIVLVHDAYLSGAPSASRKNLKELSIKDVLNQEGGGVDPVRTFYSQERLFRCGRPHILVQNTSDFSKFMVCPHGQRRLNQCGHFATRVGVDFSRFCADIFYRWPLILRHWIFCLAGFLSRIILSINYLTQKIFILVNCLHDTMPFFRNVLSVIMLVVTAPAPEFLKVLINFVFIK